MARILCATQGLPGMLYASIELCLRLRAAGHRPIYAGPGSIAAAVTGHNLDFVALPESTYHEFLDADRRRSRLHRLSHVGERQRQALSHLGAAGFAQMLRDLDVDLALIDIEMHEHVITGSAARIPIAVLNSFFSIWRAPGSPPPHRLVVPGRGVLGSRPGTRLLWLDLRARKALRVAFQRLRRAGCDRLSLLRLLAADHGFDWSAEVDFGHWLIPFTYRRLPTLSLHAAEIDFARAAPPNVSYLGPLVLRDRRDRPTPPETRESLDRLYRECRDRGRTLIYAAFGSRFSTRLSLIRRLVEAVSARRDWHLLLSLGGLSQDEDLGDLPANVSAHRWLPQPEVLSHSRLAIVHGGANTTEECIDAAIPMLAYCGYRTDMAGGTARIVHHGIGVAGRWNDTAARIRGRIEHLLETPSYRNNADRLRRVGASYAERRAAERAVEALLDAPPGSEAGAPTREPAHGSGRTVQSR